MENKGKIIFEARGISKRFPGVLALNSAHIKLKKGEIHAVVGENGSGKSTFMKIILGIYQADSGEMILKDKPYAPHAPSNALSKGISMIHQEITLIPLMTVAENIWIGREKNFKKGGFISSSLQNAAAKKLLDDIGININPKDLVGTLSVANMQLVEITRAVSYDADIIIMDEPTSALSVAEVKILFDIMHKLKRLNKTIVFITHKLDEVFEISDCITILRDGEYIATNKCEEITKDQMISMIVGRKKTTIYERTDTAEIGDIALEVREFCGGGFRDIDFHVRKGEIIGFCGLMGAGRTELMRAVFGVDHPDSGEVLLNGKNITIKSPKHAIKNGIGMVTEDRLHLGIIPRLSVKINASLSYLYKMMRGLIFVDFKRELEETNRIIELLNVKARLSQDINTLSGGNQQKTLIGRCLMLKPQVIILDEPTRGIDVGSKSEIYHHINMLAQEGIAVILVSSEIPEILSLSDRIYVMRHGYIVAEYKHESVNSEELIKTAFGA